jgi:hypothetical protein
MKVLSKLTATSTDAPNPGPSIRPGVNLEPTPGFYLNIAAHSNGLFIRTNKAAVFIPHSELIALAQLHEPALVPSTPKKEAK